MEDDDEIKGIKEKLERAELQYPGLSERVKAVLIDTTITLTTFIIVANVLGVFDTVSPVLKASLFFLIFGLYDPLLIAFTKGTLGHKAMGLVVVSESDHEKAIPLPLAFFRFLIKGFLGWISFLGIIASDRKRAMHDAMTASIVLYKKSN